MRRSALVVAALLLTLPAPACICQDDAISRLLRTQDDAAARLPVAPAKPLPQPGAGPTVGTKPPARCRW